jgi:hypothetical protein
VHEHVAILNVPPLLQENIVQLDFPVEEISVVEAVVLDDTIAELHFPHKRGQ